MLRRKLPHFLPFIGGIFLIIVWLTHQNTTQPNLSANDVLDHHVSEVNEKNNLINNKRTPHVLTTKETAKNDEREEKDEEENDKNKDSDVIDIDINVNNNKKIIGKRIKDQLYVPFSFVAEYFGVYGENVGGGFKWLHVNPSHADPNTVYPKYTITGPYLSFHTSNVPRRARVKCICGKNEVPITTQWDPNGYYYPTQIAQYGLSFLSKYHLESKNQLQQELLIPQGDSESLSDFPDALHILKIKFQKKIVPIHVRVKGSNGKNYVLSYLSDNTQIERSTDGMTITHGLGKNPEGRSFITRDLNVDLMKGLSFIKGQRNGKTISITIEKILDITSKEWNSISKIILLDKDYEAIFLAAANWFINFQDDSGGWKVYVKRVIRKGMEASPGWYSAMGQGQAISLLSRVYLHTKDEKYLNAAMKATIVFHRMSSDHGVKADLFGSPWYEEYPTTPPSFVLNGFIFSLFGLYDLWKIGGDIRGANAQKLFLDGFQTLEKMIPLYDNGHGTFYDLRHISIPGISPNRARWQYHKVHLEQLNALISIKESEILTDVLKRWVGYTSGILSRHN